MVTVDEDDGLWAVTFIKNDIFSIQRVFIIADDAHESTQIWFGIFPLLLSQTEPTQRLQLVCEKTAGVAGSFCGVGHLTVPVRGKKGRVFHDPHSGAAG